MNVLLFGSSFQYLTAVAQKHYLLADFWVFKVFNLNNNDAHESHAANRKMANGS